MKIIVNPHKLEIAKEPVNEREIDITKCEFEFADEITNDYVKEAYFTFKGKTYKQIIVNNECDIPSEVLTEKGQVEIGVVAFKTEGAEEIKRYNPSPAYFNTWVGSLKDNAENSEPITPSEMEQYEQALQDGLEEVNDKLDDIDQALEDVNQAITETNNLDLDVSKSGKTATVTFTKKDATTKVVTLSDGTSLMFNWDGTKLGIKTDEDAEYIYVDLQGVQGPIGPKGEAFTIKKTYTSVAEMNADFNNMQLGDYVMIASTVEVEDNAKLYTRGETQWIFISDFSGATGIRGETGLTPNIQIGTVTSGTTPSVTRTGTNENPILNFTLVKGDTGATGPIGETGATGNGIASVVKTGTSGLVDTYTITFTDGSTTTFNITNGEDGEVTQEQLDEVQAELERYKLLENALPHTENETASDYVTLENTAKSPMEIETIPQTSQETTSGKNLLNVSQNLTWTQSRTITIDLPVGSYYISCTSVSDGGTNGIWARLRDNAKNFLLTNNSSQQFTIDNPETRLILYSNGVDYAGSAGISATVNELMISSSGGDYEPYTNGPAPNPDYPQDIHCITGDNSVKVVGKNLFDSNLFSNFIDSIKYISLQLKPNTNYTLSSSIPNGGTNIANVFIITSQGQASSANNGVYPNSPRTITSLNDGIIRIGYRDNGNRLDDEATKYWYMLNEGSTATSYTPYEETTYPISLGNKEMFNISNVSDGFVYDETTDKFYINRKIGKTSIIGSNVRLVDSYANVEYGSVAKPNDFSGRGVYDQIKVLCNKAHYVATSILNTSDNVGIICGNADRNRWWIGFAKGTGLTNIQTSLDGSIIVYPLLTENPEEITDTTLIGQLRAIKNALSMQGTTHIISTASGENLPFLIKARAVQNISNS